MGFPFLYFWWLYLHNGPLEARASQESDYRECDGDDEDFCGIVGQILLSYCIGILTITLINRAYVWILQKHQGEVRPSSKETSHSKVPRDSVCKRHSRFSIWDFFSKFFNGKTKKHPCQSAKPAHCSEEATAWTYLERKQTRLVAKLNRQTVCDSDSSDINSEDLDSEASSWKESETEYIPTMANLRQKKKALKQRNAESHWIREQPCLRCKAKRTRKWLSQHFYNPMPPAHGKSITLEENSSMHITT
ncbi:serine-rich single-pass membrane protein 1 [Pelodiscus sinensis]|uniref:serine-rich single-pass membrane protein 1 n=1 Tax=Pelodiscus sinensis TaxID=13735 RepID=UPI000D71DFC3|nr:serine-rich single-pass membrane protein 1 [Pelodiscus sinensis]|eukprot:XP_025039000.1 serine-rich single-pass membrane protein 1 [Pelodiscus sinensis]